MIQLLHPPYALIADDMTGATDTGVQFTRAQCRVRTFFSGWTLHSLTGVDLVVVDTDSRGLEAGNAATIVRACVEQLLSHGIRLLYKKIDSTLRGPIGAELEAIMEAADFRQAIVCPAYPSTGRTVADGMLLVYGQPVSETPIGDELISPVRESHIPTLIGSQCSLPVHHLPRQIVDQGENEIAAAVAAGESRKRSIWICDATEARHLENLARFLASADDDVLAVGSGGLAEPFARLVAPRLRVRRPADVLFVCGSSHPVTRDQVAALLRAGNGRHIEFEPTVAEPTGWDAWVRQNAQEFIRSSPVGSHLVLTMPTWPVAELAPRSAARQLAMLATYVLEARPVAGVVVTGGDSARALLEQWQATGIDLLAEVAPGVPLGRVVDGQYVGTTLITKAGGFGAQDLFLRVAALLSDRPEISARFSPV